MVIPSISVEKNFKAIEKNFLNLNFKSIEHGDRFHPKCTAQFHQSVPVNFM